MFLHAPMLAALAGALLPLALHFLAKARYRSQDWGAMMFLEDAAAPRVTTGRLRQAALLAVRSAIVAALAFAMARPVADAASPLAARESGGIIILLDASSDPVAGGRTRFDLAKQAAAELIAAVGPNDRVAVGLASSDLASLEPSADLVAASARLAELSADAQPVSLADLFSRCARRLTSPRQPTVLALITDGRSTAGTDLDRAAADLRSALSTDRSVARFHLIRINAAAEPSLTMSGFRIAEPVVRDVPIECEIVVVNPSAVAISQAPVTITEGGRVLARQSLSLRANESRTIQITSPSLGIGPHTLSAAIDPAGSKLDATVTTRDAVRVTLIADDDHASQTAADYVRLALEPFRSAGERTADGFSTRVVQATSKAPLLRPRDDVAIVVGVASLSSDQSKQLADFALAGGGVIFLPGSSTEVRAWNERLFDDGRGPLPAAIEEPAGDGAPTTVVDSHGFSTEPFRVSRAMQIDERAADAQVTSTLPDGKPLIIERPFGYGRLAMLTVSPDLEWTDLPTTDGFVAAMQNFVRRMSHGESATVSVGEPLLARFEVAGVRNVTVVTPSDLARDAEVRVVGGYAFVRYAGTSVPGRYVVRLRGEVLEQRRVFLVRSPAGSDSPRVGDDWPRVASLVGVEPIEYSPGALAGRFTFVGRGRELWPAAIVAAAALLLAETLLVRWLSRRAA